MFRFLKYIISSFVLILLFQVSLFSQTKDDVIECLTIVFELPEMEVVFQHDLAEGEGVIIEKQLEIRFNANEIERIMYELEESDFWDFSKPVRYWTKDEIISNGFLYQHALRLSISFENNEVKIRTSTYLDEDRRKFVQGAFRLKKKGFNWELFNKSVNIR